MGYERIAVSLKEDDQKLLTKLKLAIHKRTGKIPSTTAVVREGLGALAKKEKVA